jgi:hypothetical protein
VRPSATTEDGTADEQSGTSTKNAAVEISLELVPDELRQRCRREPRLDRGVEGLDNLIDGAVLGTPPLVAVSGTAREGWAGGLRLRERRDGHSARSGTLSASVEGA